MSQHKFACLLLGASCLMMASPALAGDNTGILSQLRQEDGSVGVRPASKPQSSPASAQSDSADSSKVQIVHWKAPTWMRAADKPMGLNAQAKPDTTNPGTCCGSDWGVSAMLGWDSEHIFRGAQQAKQNAVAEVEFTQGNYYAGVWGMLPTEDQWDSYATRVDVYGGSTFDISRSVFGDVGLTGYLYPQDGALVNSDNSVEGYVGFGLDNAFSPTLYGYYDIVRDRYTLEASAEYRLPLARTDFVLGGTAGYTGGDGLDYGYFRADAEIVQNINRHASIGIGGHFAYSTEDTFLDGLTYSNDTTEWFGIRLRANKGK